MKLPPVTRPIIRPICQSVTGALGGGFSPISLFSGTDKGYIYDNNDLSSFYLDSAGTTPATVNGLVGLQLDKSGGLALGSEIMVNGDFSSGGTAGWVADNSTLSGAGGVFTITSTIAGNGRCGYNFTTVANRAYRVSFTVMAGGTATAEFRVRDGGTVGAGTALFTQGLLGAGTYSILFIATSTTTHLELYAAATVIGQTSIWDNISVKELPGNHRYQTTTGSKPILRGTPVGSNLVTNGDFASGASWSAGSGWAIGSGVATATAATGFLSATLTTAVVASRIYRITYTIVTATAGSVRPNIGGIDGVSRSAAGTYTDYITAFNTGTFVMSPTTFSGSVDNIEVVDVSAGQVTAPYGLQYDGIDDFLTTASVDFTATDKMAVVMGVRKFSDAAAGSLASLGNVGSVSGSFEVLAPSGAGVNNYGAQVRGNVANSVYTFTTYVAPITNVVSVAMDFAAAVGSEAVARVNGATPTTATGIEAGTGPFANQPMYFGRRTGTILPLNGLDFGGICVNKTLTATQLSSAERWTASRTGVTI